MKNISNYINEAINESATPKQVKFGKIIEYSIGGTKISASNFDSEYESISDGNDVDEHFKNKEDEIAFIKQHKNDIIENGVSSSDAGEFSGNNGNWYNEFTIDGVNFSILTDKAFFKKEYPFVAHTNHDNDITFKNIKKMNEFIGKLNGKTLSFKYDDVAKQIYVYQLFKNKLPKELGMEKCLSYEEFNLAVERLKVKIKSV